MTSPRDAARARLAYALLAGQDTAPHRAAIARLESNARAAEERRATDAMATQEQRAAAVQEHADGLAADAQAQVDALLAAHPVPAAVDDHHG
ncbi:MAG TPA: hypothetical protein VIR76_05870 [Pusillimonas sp.]